MAQSQPPLLSLAPLSQASSEVLPLLGLPLGMDFAPLHLNDALSMSLGQAGLAPNYPRMCHVYLVLLYARQMLCTY